MYFFFFNFFSRVESYRKNTNVKLVFKTIRLRLPSGFSSTTHTGNVGENLRVFHRKKKKQHFYACTADEPSVFGDETRAGVSSEKNRKKSKKNVSLLSIVIYKAKT